MRLGLGLGLGRNRRAAAGGGGGGGYAGPLDIVSGAVVAFSQRRMSAVWTGDVITLRRASDDAVQSFAADTDNAVDRAAVETFMGATTYALVSAAVGNPGSGYAADSNFDVTVVGPAGTPAVVNVSTDENGAVNGIFDGVVTPGSYAALPANPVAATGGTGSGLTLYLQFGVLTGGAFVAALLDQSGNGSDVAQSDPTKQPAWLPDGSILFDGVDDMLVSAGNVAWTGEGFTALTLISTNFGITGRQYTLGVNANAGSAAGPDINIGPSAYPTGNWDFSTDDAGYSNGAGGNYTTDDDPLNLGIPANRAVLFDGWVGPPNVGEAHQNGHALTTSGLGFGTGVTGAVNLPLVLGASDAVSPNQFVNGSIIEIVPYDTALDPGDITTIRQNIAAYYGVTLSA